MLETRRPAEDQIVGQQDGKGLVADERAGAPHRVAQAGRLHLARLIDLSGVWQVGLELVERVELAARRQVLLKLDAMIEVVFDHRLAPAGDEDEPLDARGPRLFYRVLDQRFVNHGQHLLRHRLGSREESRPEAAHGKDGGADRYCHVWSTRLLTRNGQLARFLP